ncbi:hypothetical protein HPB49_008848 [Dermacentor silvarum]|uniref:Uncharacterized protein n=1 Tax=Dermacentor silvarum TaxID=543639 RepID=A0ACB8CK94_DERSI|nr:hypothetical protein HPB49_008848 [Dermacentor silvarum]
MGGNDERRHKVTLHFAGTPIHPVTEGYLKNLGVPIAAVGRPDIWMRFTGTQPWIASAVLPSMSDLSFTTNADLPVVSRLDAPVDEAIFEDSAMAATRTTKMTVSKVRLLPPGSLRYGDGRVLACAINAACLASIDAAVSMKCHIAAVTAAITNTGIIVLDPDSQQEQEARAVCTFSFESKESKLVSTYTSGQFSKEEFQRCLALCQAAAGDIFAFYQDALQKRYCQSFTADGGSDAD